jgi:hypothetical protein
MLEAAMGRAYSALLSLGAISLLVSTSSAFVFVEVAAMAPPTAAPAPVAALSSHAALECGRQRRAPADYGPVFDWRAPLDPPETRLA